MPVEIADAIFRRISENQYRTKYSRHAFETLLLLARKRDDGGQAQAAGEAVRRDRRGRVRRPPRDGEEHDLADAAPCRERVVSEPGDVGKARTRTELLTVGVEVLLGTVVAVEEIGARLDDERAGRLRCGTLVACL